MASHRRPRSPAVPPSAAASLAGRLPLRILVADDLPSNRDVLVLMLRHLGYEPEVAPGGPEAMATIAARQFDLLLLDIRMPELDGYQIAREVVRRFPAGRARPRMLAVTADDPGVARQAIAAGMDGVIAKPITLSAVVRSMLQVFGRPG